MRDHAVALARAGFRVFKLEIGGKRPAVPAFYDAATDDPAAAHRMWTCPVSGESTDHNIGIATGDGLMVVDVDVKNGAKGAESLGRLQSLGLDLNTTRARTASGGLHLYYSTPRDRKVKNSRSEAGDGIDVRGHHGYVVAPGSIIGGIRYTWEQAPNSEESGSVND